MALIAGSTYTYKEGIIDNKGIMLTIKNRAEEQGWIVLKYDVVDYDVLVLKAPDGSFCVGFQELTSILNEVYNIEVTMFKDFNDKNGIHNQLLSIPKDEHKGFNEGNHPPQLVCAADSTDMWLQITPDYISAIVKSPIDASPTKLYTTFYAGRFNSYAEKEQYFLPIFCGGSGQAEDNILTQDGKTPSDSSVNSLGFDTFSNYMFSRRDSPTSSSYRSGDYFLSPDGRWVPLGSGASGAVDSYPNLSTSNVPPYFQNATIFPIAGLMYATKGSMIDGEYILRPITIIGQPDYTEKSSMMGEIFNIYRVEDETLVAEDEIVVDGENYIVFHDVYRDLNSNNLFALKVI